MTGPMQGDRTTPSGEQVEVQRIYIREPAVDDSIDLRQVWDAAWADKWIIVAITAVCFVASVAYALLATPIYRAEVLLAPVSDNPMESSLARFGGLANLAGISLGTGDDKHAMAVLRSKALVEDFIREEKLMPVLFADEPEQMHKSLSGGETPLDIRDGVSKFDRVVRSISEDNKTGLIKLSVQWTDAEVAADWARKLVAKANDQIRQRSIQESEQRLKYLNEQLAKASFIELREAISRVIESEVKSMMLAQVQTEYAFKVIDPAVVPKYRAAPRRTLIVLAATFVGVLLGVALAVLRRNSAFVSSGRR